MTGSYDRKLKIWDKRTGQCILSIENHQEAWIFDAMLSETQVIR